MTEGTTTTREEPTDLDNSPSVERRSQLIMFLVGSANHTMWSLADLRDTGRLLAGVDLLQLAKNAPVLASN
jgi:hypothetical protein